MKLVKIILTYVLAVPSIILTVSVSFLAIREVLYRSTGRLTEMSKHYVLTDKQAIIFNSIDGLYEIVVLFILIRWLYKKKYNLALIASVVVLIIFLVMAHIADGWRR